MTDSNPLEDLEQSSEVFDKAIGDIHRVREKYQNSMIGFTQKDELEMIDAMDRGVSAEAAFRKIHQEDLDAIKQSRPANEVELKLATLLAMAQDYDEEWEAVTSFPKQPLLRLGKRG